MNAPTVDWPPDDVVDGMGDYLEAMECLVRHVVAIRDRFGPLIARYSAWVEAEPRGDGWFEMAEVVSGMGHAYELAGAAVRLADETLVPGGANDDITDDRLAELVHHTKERHP